MRCYHNVPIHIHVRISADASIPMYGTVYTSDWIDLHVD